MISEDRSDRWVAVVIAVVFHSLLLAMLIPVTASRRTRSQMPHDAPVRADDFLPDARISGTAAQQEPLVHFVRCDYAFLPAAREARLVGGPLQEPGRLGCRITLPLHKPVAAEIEIRYDQQGEIVEIRGDQTFQGSETEVLVAGWKLAQPRDDYHWVDTPVYLVSIRAHTN